MTTINLGNLENMLISDSDTDINLSDFLDSDISDASDFSYLSEVSLLSDMTEYEGGGFKFPKMPKAPKAPKAPKVKPKVNKANRQKPNPNSKKSAKKAKKKAEKAKKKAKKEKKDEGDENGDSDQPTDVVDDTDDTYAKLPKKRNTIHPDDSTNPNIDLEKIDIELNHALIRTFKRQFKKVFGTAFRLAKKVIPMPGKMVVGALKNPIYNKIESEGERLINSISINDLKKLLKDLLKFLLKQVPQQNREEVFRIFEGVIADVKNEIGTKYLRMKAKYLIRKANILIREYNDSI